MIQMASLSSSVLLGYRLNLGTTGIFACLVGGLIVGALGNFLVFSRSPMKIIRTSADLLLDQRGLLDLAQGITDGSIVVYDPERSREIGLEFRASRASLIILAGGVNSEASYQAQVQILHNERIRCEDQIGPPPSVEVSGQPKDLIVLAWSFLMKGREGRPGGYVDVLAGHVEPARVWRRARRAVQPAIAADGTLSRR